MKCDITMLNTIEYMLVCVRAVASLPRLQKYGGWNGQVINSVPDIQQTENCNRLRSYYFFQNLHILELLLLWLLWNSEILGIFISKSHLVLQNGPYPNRWKWEVPQLKRKHTAKFAETANRPFKLNESAHFTHSGRPFYHKQSWWMRCCCIDSPSRGHHKQNAVWRM